MNNKIKFKTNFRKALEVALYFANKGQRFIELNDLYHLIFQADLYHLNKYGRPISGDHYFCDLNSEVIPIYSKMIISQDKFSLVHIKMKTYPSDKEKTVIVPKRYADKNFFSISDMESMDEVFASQLKLNLDVKDKVLDFEDFIVDPALIADLKAHSLTMVL
jgi:hypothetical protein